MAERSHPVELLDEMIRRLERECAEHPEAAGNLRRAEQIVCEVVRDAAVADGRAVATKLEAVVLGNGLRVTP